MRPELEIVLDSIRSMAPDDLPGLSGDLHILLAHVQLKLARPEANGIRPQDRQIGTKELAERLGVSVDYVYRHHKEWPFTTREGKKLLFSSNGVDQYIARKARKR